MAHALGASISYTRLSPEFNVAELVFNKLKTVLKREEFKILLQENVHVFILKVLNLTTTDHMFAFYNFIL